MNYQHGYSYAWAEDPDLEMGTGSLHAGSIQRASCTSGKAGRDARFISPTDIMHLNVPERGFLSRYVREAQFHSGYYYLHYYPDRSGFGDAGDPGTDPPILDKRTSG